VSRLSLISCLRAAHQAILKLLNQSLSKTRTSTIVLTLIDSCITGHPGVYRAKGGWAASITIPEIPKNQDEAEVQSVKKKKRRVCLGTKFETAEVAAAVVSEGKRRLSVCEADFEAWMRGRKVGKQSSFPLSTTT